MSKEKERIFTITDGKSRYDKNAYREVVLERGDDIVDIVYTRGAWRAKHDYNLIQSELITYGFDRAKELAEYIKQSQKSFEARLAKEQIWKTK